MDPERFKAGAKPTQDHVADNRALFDLPPPPPHSYVAKTKHKSSHGWIWGVLAIVILLAAGAAGGWYYLKHKTKSQPVATATTNQVKLVPKPQPAAPQQPAIPTDSHTAAGFGMTFSYPTTWSVVDSGSAGVTLTSPIMNLTAATGQSGMGQIVMNVAKQGSLPSGFTTSSVAVLPSSRVNYAKPSGTQAADTYLSFVQYPSTNTKGGLDGIYVTGNYGYQKDQTIPSSDVSKVSPLVYFDFFSCASSICPVSTRVPLTIASSDWQNNSFSEPILTILKSFSFD